MYTYERVVYILCMYNHCTCTCTPNRSLPGTVLARALCTAVHVHVHVLHVHIMHVKSDCTAVRVIGAPTRTSSGICIMYMYVMMANNWINMCGNNNNNLVVDNERHRIESNK